MSTEVTAGPQGPIRAASTAAGGTALSTTAAFIQLPRVTRHLEMIPRNFLTAVVYQVAYNPFLLVFKTADSLATAPTDSSWAMQDGSTATTLVLNDFDVAANGNFIYVFSHQMFRGARAIVGNTNSTVSALTVKYWDGGAWADISASDGTQTGGDTTFGQSGNVTWTVPTDWARVSLVDAGDTSLPGALFRQPYYLTRWEVSVQLDASVTLTGLVAMNRSTAYAEYLSGLAKELQVNHGPGGIGCIEALVDAGSGNLIVNAAAAYGGDFV